nr:cell wall acid trehalase [Quercus suber]
MHSRIWISTLLTSLFSFSRALIYPTRFNGTTWDDTNWRLTTTHLDQGHYQSRLSLANGYLGINLAAVGPFFEIDTPVNGDLISGWPLFNRRQTFATIAGFYDSQPTTNGTNFEWLNQYGGESVISGVPHWGGLVLRLGDAVLDANVPAAEITAFESTLDIRAATLGWRYTWTPPNGPAIDVEYEILVHKLYVNQAAVRVKVTALTNVELQIVDVLEGDCAVRSTFAGKGFDAREGYIWSAVKPVGIHNVTAYVYSTMVADHNCGPARHSRYTDEAVIGGNSSSIAQAMTVHLEPGRTSTITKYVGAASDDAFDDPQTVALTNSRSAANNGFEGLLKTHIEEWQSIMTSDSVDSFRFANGTLSDDENIVELQITAVTNPFHMLQNTIGENAIAKADENERLDVNSISVCGLGGDCYGGLIFWDAEIARYRVEKFPQAQANVQTAYQSSQNETGKFSPDGAVFSWTSGRFGNCTGTGPCFDYEYHLNGDIGLELYNYYVVTGDTAFFRDQLFPIYDAVAQFYSDVVTFNETSGRYDLYNATDPDEYANFQTNVGYTMVLMRTHIDTANTLRARFDQTPNVTWANVSSLINVPVDESANLILEYATMNNSISVKQADVVLVDDFLDYPNPYSLTDLEYYAGKQSLNGPGMTYGVFSIVANEISPSGCASYTYDLYGSQPYTRGPWFQFSEQLIDDYTVNGGTHPAYPFLTGIGGANRVAVFGYLGFRPMLDSLNVNPSLPPQISHLRYRTVYWQGWPISATSNQTHTTLKRLGTPLVNANSTFAQSPIPVTTGVDETSAFGNNTVYGIRPNGTITIRNRQIGDIKTIPNNIAQCRPASSMQEHATGQFPLSAVDGAVSTKWQPALENVTSSLTIELPQPYVPITELRFDWAQSPPISYVVTFSNSSDAKYQSPVSQSDDVTISNPYDAATAFVIAPYSSNTTNVTLAHPVWSGKYATLTIMGNRANEGTRNAGNGTGATVAEWAIVAIDGSNQASGAQEV